MPLVGSAARTLVAGAHLLSVQTVPADGIEEWWLQTPDGAEQGWTLSEGQRRIEVRLTGATAVAVEGGLELRFPDGEAWRLGRLSAQDWQGASVALRTTPTEQGYVVEVVDPAARWPIEVDPLYTTAETELAGPALDTIFGYSVAGLGDIDGDGYPDLIAGAPGVADWGAAMFYRGGPGGYDAGSVVTLLGTDPYDGLGAPVAALGDLDGDGYGEVGVGSVGGESGWSTATVYRGSSSGPFAGDGVSLGVREATSEWSGSVPAGGGDIDGDGLPEVLLGTRGVDDGTGAVELFFGLPEGTTPDLTIPGGAAGDFFGRSVAAAGDVNGDGHGDVIVGAYGADHETGAAYVYTGSTDGLDAGRRSSLPVRWGEAWFGFTVAGAGDTNGDGFDDVALGTPYGYDGGGEVEVHLGAAAGPEAGAAAFWRGAESGDAFGFAVAGVGDVDRDGFDDLLVGDPGSGAAYLFAGGQLGLATEPATSLVLGDADNSHGYAVAAAGDVDGDGYADVVVGEPGWNSIGKVRLYRGYADADADSYAATEDCDDDAAEVYPGAAERCDGIDNDCDGQVDMGVMSRWYPDEDGDGFGAVTDAVYSCDAPAGFVASATDCDDGNANRNPGSTEVCDDLAVDENCDGLADDADPTAAGKVRWFVDADGDGFGTTDQSRVACAAPPGFGADTTDCDDADANVFPGAADVAGDGVDADCDGADPSQSGAEAGRCGCAAPIGPSPAGWAIGLAALVLGRRQRRWITPILGRTERGGVHWMVG